MEFEIGDFVRTANNRQGTVRYIGGVTGKPDIWVGLELDGPEGKNDGSVQGERYFDCAPLHGIFTKYSDITHLIQSASVPAPSPSPAPRKVPSRLGAKPPAKAPAARPPSTTTTRTQRLSSVGSASAAAGTRSPTKPSSRLSGVASPTKPPPRRLSGVGASAAAAAAKHPTQTRPSLSQTRSPAVGTTRPTSQSARPSGVSGTKSAPQPSLTKRQSIGGSSAGGARTGLTRKLSTTGSSTSSVGGTTRNAAPSSTTSAATSKTPKDPASQALETRVRQLEKQHAEQQATIEELMPYKAKSEKHEALALKVSKKYQDVHQELLEAKREAASAKAESEKAREEFEINLENAILDKETAEVERDQLLDQTEMLKATIEELQLDKEIYEAEAEASLIIDEDMSDEQAQAVHIRKLQAENKRLRAVIIDFRDIDKERQADTKRLRHELETTTEAAEESAKQCTELRLKVEQHESTITTLQEQLDANNEWEEILEDVTQRANNLEEKNMRQSLEIKELETVNEVSTETIAEYVEFTNDLQAEASLRETELAELSRELEQERIQNAQKDMTLAKYSEAFADFQHQLQDQDMQQLMSEERAQGMTDKFNKMMDLHRTLQADRAKDTAKTIETELTKLSEQEAREELEILKNYLPETSTDYMDNSLRTYFRAKKIAYKASLIGSVLTGMETFTNEGAEKVLTNVYRHDTVYHLDYIRSHGEHFVATLANCTLEQFRKAVTEYEDISVVETTIDRTLDNLKRDELNMKDLSESIRGTDKIMRGITSISQRLSSNRPDNDLVLYVSLLRSSLERIRASFDAVKQYTQLVADFEPETEDRLDALVERLRKPQTSALECIAVVGKLSQALLTLQNDDLYPQFPSGAQEVLELSDNLSSYADKAHEFTRQVITFDPNDEDETPSVDIEELTSTIDSAMNIFSPKDMDGLLKDIKSNVAHWFEYASILNNTAEIERLPSPWIVRAQEIEASKKHAIDSEKKLQLLTTEHQSTLIQIREREEIIDTKDLEIEHLRAKHKEAVAKTEALDQLQKELQDAKNEQATYKREIKKHVDEIEQLKHSAAEMLRSSPNASTPNAAVPTENAAPTGTAATHKADKKKPTVDDELVSGSFATFIKALKKENTWLRQREYAASMARAAEFLPPLRKIPDSRHRMARAEELLEMAWSLPSLPSPDTVGNEEARSSSKKSGKPSSLRIYDPDVSLVDDLCFVDLEPVADGFDELLLDEMMR